MRYLSLTSTPDLGVKLYADSQRSPLHPERNNQIISREEMPQLPECSTIIPFSLFAWRAGRRGKVSIDQYDPVSQTLSAREIYTALTVARCLRRTSRATRWH